MALIGVPPKIVIMKENWLVAPKLKKNYQILLVFTVQKTCKAKVTTKKQVPPVWKQLHEDKINFYAIHKSSCSCLMQLKNSYLILYHA